LLRRKGLLDSVLVTNETLDEVKSKGKKCIIVRVDFEKVYDMVRWDYLEHMMSRLGFCSTWIRWMMSCLKSASISLLVNGSPTKEFKPQKGLRQGDPNTFSVSCWGS